MARLTEEQKDALAVLCGEDLFGAIVESILRLDEPEEPAVDADAVRANQERTIEDLGEALASAIDERDEAMSKIVETERRAAREAADFVDRSFALECERDEARAKLAEYQAGSIAVRLAEVERERDEALAAQSSTVHAARAGWRARALASAIAERDEAKADHDALARAVGQALLVPTLGDNEEFVEPSDHAIVGAMLGMRNARDTALARLAKVEAERDEARAKLADVDRLLAIEEQAKRVARAEKWCEWARLAYLWLLWRIRVARYRQPNRMGVQERARHDTRCAQSRTPQASRDGGGGGKVSKSASFTEGERVLFQTVPGAVWEVGAYLVRDIQSPANGSWHWVRDERGLGDRHYVPTRRLRKARGGS